MLENRRMVVVAIKDIISTERWVVNGSVVDANR